MASPSDFIFGVYAPGGAPLTGAVGSLSFATYKDDLGTNLTQPSFTEIGGGLYKFTPTFSIGRAICYIVATSGNIPVRFSGALRPEDFGALAALPGPQIVVFAVFDPSTGLPKTGVTCAFSSYRDNLGNSLVQPTITEIGGGLYKFAPVFAGNYEIAYVVGTAGNNPLNFSGFIRPEDFTQSGFLAVSATALPNQISIAFAAGYTLDALSGSAALPGSWIVTGPTSVIVTAVALIGNRVVLTTTPQLAGGNYTVAIPLVETGGGGGVTLSSIAITPASPAPTIGQVIQMTATGTYSDSSTANITSSVLWASQNTGIVTISNGSAGGILTGIGVGSTTVSATLGAISNSTPATVTGAVMTVSGPIPDATVVFGATAAVLAYAIKVPSDATSFYLKISNRTGISNGVGNSVVSNIAVYKSNGAGKPTGSSFGTFLAQTVPGNGTELTLGPIAVARGTDGNIVVVYSVPASANLSEAQYQTWGAYVSGTTTVDPAPGGWTDYNLGLFWLVPQFITAKRRIVVLGDSISVGASPGTAPGFLASAWNVVANDKGYSIGIYGMSGSRLNQWADPATYPALWADQLFTGADAYIEVGVNDLVNQTAAQMEASLTVVYNHCKASGCAKVYVNTIAPDSTYIANDAQRLAYNIWVRANSLGFDGIVDLAKSQATGGLASNTDLTVLFAGYDNGDGIHWNASGHLQAALAIEAVIG